MNKLGTAQIIQGDARALPLPDNSVDLICTSPPYFALRAYQDAGETYANQMGSEATPAEFLDALLAATREMVRVLKPSGSIFVNLGDKYSGAQQQTSGRQSSESSSDFWKRTNPKNTGIPAKSLMGIPWRYAIACIDDLGLILRAEIIWAKPNGLPESVTDRVRRSHEQWFHFSVQPRYFAAVDEIREEQVSPVQRTRGGASVHRSLGRQGVIGESRDQTKPTFPVMDEPNPLGKLPGSVWTIPTQPLTVPPELGVDHFAAYPMEWPRRIIQGWTPNGVCTACGQGRRPTRGVDWSKVPHRIVEKRRISKASVDDWCARFADWCKGAGVTRRMLDEACGSRTMGYWWTAPGHNQAQVPTPEQHANLVSIWPNIPDHPGDELWETYSERVSLMDKGDESTITGRHNTTGGGLSSGDYRTITGYVCGCADATAPTTPAVVLDPFGGTGTTALVAKALGRTGISIDLSSDYCRLAKWRCNDPRELAAALQVEKPEPVHPDQLNLFDEAP